MSAVIEEEIKFGIVSDLSNADYHADKTSYSSSLIKLMSCPAKAKHYMDNGSEYKDVFRLGTAIHTLVLEPEKFDSEFLIGIDCARRSKDDKTQWAAWYREHGWTGAYDFVMNNPAASWNPAFIEATGKNLVTPAEIDELKAMAESVLVNANARELLEKGEAEQSVYWQDEETGLNLRCRPDFLNTAGFISDLKSCDSASRPAVMSKIYNLGYHISDALYRDGVYHATGEWMPFLYIFIEKQAPYQCVVYSLDDASMELAHNQYRENLRTLARCLERDEWPGYDDKLDLRLPAYAFTQ